MAVRPDGEQVAAVGRVARVDVPPQPAPVRELRRGRDPGHSGHAEGGEQADAVERAPAEQHRAEPREVAGGAEQPRVAGGAAHAPRRGVVHPPPQHDRAGAPAGPRQRGARLGRGDAGGERGRRVEGGVDHRQGPENPLVRKAFEGCPADPPDDLAQQHEVQVAVDEPFAGGCGRRQGDGAGDRRFGALEDLVKRQVGGEAGGVRQQLGDGDRLPALASEPRHVIGDAVAQTQAPLFDEHHDGGGRRHDLGQGREIEHRVERHRLGCPRCQRARPEGPLVHDLAGVPHEHHRAGKTPVADGLLDHRVDPREAGRVDRGRGRCRVPGEPQAGGGVQKAGGGAQKAGGGVQKAGTGADAQTCAGRERAEAAGHESGCRTEACLRRRRGGEGVEAAGHESGLY